MEKLTSDITAIARILFETAAEGLLVTDKQGVIRVVNPRVNELFGYDEGELVGQPVDILIPQSKRDDHTTKRENYHQRPTRRSMGMGMDLEGVRKDESTFPVEISLNHFTENGDIYVMALISDITERKRVEAKLVELNEELEARVDDRTRQLKESQLLYSMIARSYPNGTINVFDKDFTYVFAEGKEMYRLGITSENLVGTNYFDRVAPDIADSIKDEFAKAFQGEEVNFEIYHGDNWYLMSAVGLPTGNGDIGQIVVVEQNITAQKQAEKDVREALSKEKELNELKSRFVSMASHEFRTPLSTVLSSATLIDRHNAQSGNERITKHVTKIKSSVQHLTGILNDFLSLDKLEQGTINPQITKFNLRGLCSDLVSDMKDLAHGNREIDFNYEGHDEVHQDQNIIKNILLNLMSNALKYSPTDKPVGLKVQASDTAFKLEVSDKGIGIPESEQRHLFERFFRAKNAGNIEGTGLGLHIVKKYLDMLGGNVKFESNPEIGTTFYIELPNSK